MDRIYLDNNATTRLDERVFDEMTPYLKEHYGNSSSMHEFGRKAKMALEGARESVYRALNASNASEIVFTSGGTEADNLALKGAALSLKSKGDHIITTKIEHSAILNTCKHLESEGFKVTYLPVDQYGVVDLEALKKEITSKTILVSVMYANNEIGTLQPIEEIAKIVKEKGILFHTDAVQAIGKIPVDVKKLGADMLSLSGHKIHGPKGVGVLYVKKGVKLTPLLHGGHHEKNRRAGTENIAGIAGLGKAISFAMAELPKDNEKMLKLRTKLERSLIEKIKYVRLNGHPTLRLPNTVNLGFKFIEGESILLNLDMEGVAVSTGSACTSGSLEPSHVLTAMGVDAGDAQGSIRFSLSKYNTEEEIDYVIRIMPGIIEKLRNLSPLYTG